MKKVLLVLSLLALTTGAAQAQKFMTRTGKVSFDATTPSSPEKINGINNEVASIMDAATGDVLFQVPMKSFKFERELMQEHFNENYVESDKYPRAEFKGKITNLSEMNLAKDGTYPAKVTGKLTLHGVTKEVNEQGTIIVKGTTIKIKTKFVVRLSEYKVDVPSLVADKVSKDATIILESDLAKK